MNILKKLFPFSFGASSVADLIIKVLVHLAVGIVVGFLIGILAKIWLIGTIFSVAGSLIDLYILAGVVILFLDYFKILR